MFKPEKYTPPKFDREPFISFPDVTTEKAGDGYIPENFYATTIYPEYFKINGEWKMLTGSRMDCSVVIKDGMPYAVEMRNIKKDDEVVVNRTDDGRDGIFVHADGFSAPENSVDQAFAFRMGQSRETSYSRDYDRLYDILRHDRDHRFRRNGRTHKVPFLLHLLRCYLRFGIPHRSTLDLGRWLAFAARLP